MPHSRDPFIHPNNHHRNVQNSNSLRYQELNRRQEQPQKSEGQLVQTVKFLWFVACSLGMIYHLYDTTEMYLKYSTNSQVIIDSNDNFIPPSMTMCFSFNQIIIPSKLDDARLKILKKYQCQTRISTLVIPACGHLLNGLGIDKILNDMSVHLSDTLLPHQWNRIEEKVNYYSMGYKCLKVSRYNNKSKSLGPPNMDFLELENKNIFTVKFNGSFVIGDTLTFKIYIHNSTRLHHIREGNNLIVESKNGMNTFQIDCQIVKSTYLKHPFESDCINYGIESKYKSKGNCFESCYGGEYGNSNDQNGFITTDNFDLLNYDLKFSKPRKVHSNIEENCRKKCKTDCYTDMYFPKVIDKFAINAIPDEIIMTLYQNYPTNNINMVPSFDTNSYIIYLASVVALWFGCSLYFTLVDSFKLVHSMFGKISNHKPVSHRH